jgi:hypothetical protein
MRFEREKMISLLDSLPFLQEAIGKYNPLNATHLKKIRVRQPLAAIQLYFVENFVKPRNNVVNIFNKNLQTIDF